MAAVPGAGLFDPLIYVVGFAVGQAIAPVLQPVIQDEKNAVWSSHRVKPFDAHVAAAMVVEGIWSPDRGDTEAGYTGIGSKRFADLVELTDDPPSIETLLRLLRRKGIDPGKFQEALQHLRIERDYWGALDELKIGRLDAAAIANAIQQGHLPNPGVLPVIPPGIILPQGYVPGPAPDQHGPDSVPLTQIDLPPLDEALADGVDLKRLQVLANLAGLPPGPEALLTMWNRSLIDEDSVDAGIREGHMKTKWAHAYKRMRWAVLTAPEYAELHLRDWITEAEMNAGGALTGHTPQQMRNLYRNRGRTATPRQVWLAAARKKVGPRGVITDQTDHEQAIRRSNIRPEYSDMLWEIRFNYPPLFQLNRLVQQGAITPDTAADWATWNLYGPEVITALSKYWQQIYPGGDGTTDTVDAARVKSAQTKALTEIENAYVRGNSDSAQTRDWLGLIGVNDATADQLLPIWDVRRAVPQTGLTAAQIKKAAANLPAAWPRDRAIRELQDLGLTADDAATLLDE